MSSIASFAESITVEDLERDPFPIYRRLRDEAPVCHVPAVGLTLVTRWDDVHHVALHPELFTADVGASPLTRTLGQNVLTVDGEAQKRIRATLDPPMRPKGGAASAGTYMATNGALTTAWMRFPLLDGERRMVKYASWRFRSCAQDKSLVLKMRARL